MTTKQYSDNPDLIQWLDTWSALGWAVIPLRGKAPLFKEWQRTPPEEIPDYDLFQPGTNYGVVLQDTDLVIDVDPRNFPPGQDPLAALVSILELPRPKQDTPNSPHHEPTLADAFDTFTVRTGSGGYHIWLKKPPAFPIKCILQAYPGIEFKTKGTQVVGPGCIHPDTKMPYVVHTGRVTHIRNAKTDLLALLKKYDPTLSLTPQSPTYSDDEQTISRYIEYLQKAHPAVQGDNGDHLTFITACAGKDLGLTAQKTLDLMLDMWNPRCTPPWTIQELNTKVHNAYKYGQSPAGVNNPKSQFAVVGVPEDKLPWQFRRDKDGNNTQIVLKSITNTVCYFDINKETLSGMLSFNDFSENIEFNRRAPWHHDKQHIYTWTDEDAIQAKYHLSRYHKYEVQTPMVHEAALIVAQRNRWHPVMDYLSKLIWDGKPRLDTWLPQYLSAPDNKYTRQAGAKTLIAAVTRIYHPGCKFDHMLVLEGKQGTGKSTVVSILGGPWYRDITLDPSNKDTVDALRGAWVAEISEMECTRRSETQALKAFISRQEDFVRLAYARTHKPFPRKCVFIGTINPEAESGYLKDTTGNRRFWPVRTHEIFLGMLKQDRDQLWAEAVQRYKQKEALYFQDKEVIDTALAEQHQRQISDPWAPIIAQYMEDNPTLEYLSAKDIFSHILGGISANFSNYHGKRISTIMENFTDWTPGRHWDPVQQKTFRGYKRIIDIE